MDLDERNSMVSMIQKNNLDQADLNVLFDIGSGLIESQGYDEPWRRFVLC